MSKTVLVVDDNADLRESVAEALQMEGYQVAQAVNGRHALNYLEEASELPCMILLDLMMPEMDGLEFRVAQMSKPGWTKIPVIMFTATQQDGSKLQSSAHPPLAHLPKPLELDLLLDTVRCHCGAGA